MSVASYCGSARRTNTGAFDCDEARKIPLKLALGGAVFVDADFADDDTFKAAVIAKSKLAHTDEEKLFFIHNILDPQDKTDAPKTGKVGEGPLTYLVEGKPTFEYSVEIGQDLFKRLRKLNKRKINVFTLDDAGKFWGAENTAGDFIGAKALFFIYGNTQQTPSSPVKATIAISYISEKQYHDEAFYAEIELGSEEPEGLVDVDITKVSQSSNVFKLDLKAPTAKKGGFINYAKKYSTQLVVGLFFAKTGATFGTSLALTSVAYDSTLECMTVTTDSTAYGLLASGAKIKFGLVIPPTLDAADVTGIEGVDLIVAKP
jgi:hypothetical protein